MDGPDGPAESDRVQAEHDNLRAALHWFRESGQVEQGLLLIGDLGNFWYQRGYVDEGVAHAESFVNSPMAQQRTLGRARALRPVGWLRLARGEGNVALDCFAEAHSIFVEQGDQLGMALCLFGQGECHVRLGDMEQGRYYLKSALPLFRGLGEDAQVVRILFQLGNLAIHDEDLELARELLDEAIALARAGGLKQVIALTLSSLGWLAELIGDNERAAGCYAERLVLFVELGHPQHIAPSIDQIAAFIHRRGQLGQSVCLLSVAAVMRERSGIDFDSSKAADQLDTLRAELSTSAFEAAWTRGQEMQLDDAVDFALQSLAACRSAPEAVLAASLSPREVEVLQLIAIGQSNREIAEALFLSPRTVERHIANIYLKIDVHSRAEAIDFARRHRIG